MIRLLGRLLLIFTFLPFWQGSIALAGRTSQPAPTPAAVYTIPRAASINNPAGTMIAVRYSDPVDAATLTSRAFNVAGSASGKHTGQVALANDGRTVSFKPHLAFEPGERVNVQIQNEISSSAGQKFRPLTFWFTTARALSLDTARAALEAVQDPLPSFGPASSEIASAAARQYVTTPPDFPVINVTTPANQADDGYIFASNFKLHNNSGSYLLMLDNAGEPVYYQKLDRNLFACDFKKLPDGTLAYWDSSNLSYRILDSSYQLIDTISPLNGYTGIDNHDIQLLPNGDYIYLIYFVFPLDMSAYGGMNPANIIGLVIQEQDKAKNLVFEWHSWDHIPITDTNQDLTAALIDYVHGNAIELDSDGNLLLSARNLDEIIKINHQITIPPDPNLGQTIWTLGGKANQFKFSAGSGISDVLNFYYQQDIRRLPDGHITLFDNHAGHDASNSRALEYILDETDPKNYTATLVWEYRQSPDTFSSIMGNVQRLASGNTLIGWGDNASVNISEIKPDGSKALEMNFNGSFISYRAFRFQWVGNPTQPPRLALQTINNILTLTYSWNGATEIASYQIFAGNSTAATTFLASQPKTGFETSTALTADQAAYCYFRVTPVDRLGQARTSSNLVLNPACGIKNYLPLIAR